MKNLGLVEKVYVEMGTSDCRELINRSKEFKKCVTDIVTEPSAFYINNESIQEYLNQTAYPTIKGAREYIKQRYNLDYVMDKIVTGVLENEFEEVDIYVDEQEEICVHSSDTEGYLVQRENDFVECEKCEMIFNLIPLEEEYLGELTSMATKLISYIETCKTLYGIHDHVTESLERTKEGIMLVHELFDNYLKSESSDEEE